MSELGPTDIDDSSRNTNWVCPVSPVVMCSLKITSWPITSRRGATPGSTPVACGLTALLTPTLCWARRGLVPAVSNRPRETAIRRERVANPGIQRLPETPPTATRWPGIPRRPPAPESIAPACMAVMRREDAPLPPSIRRPARPDCRCILRLLLAGKDPGGEVGRDDGRPDRKIAAGFRRIRAEKGAVDGAGDPRLSNR